MKYTSEPFFGPEVVSLEVENPQTFSPARKSGLPSGTPFMRKMA